MQNRRAILISLVCFGISLFLISAYVDAKRRELTSEFGEIVPVVVASKDIKEYEIIQPGSLEVRQMYKKFKQPQTVSEVVDLVGKGAYVGISQGEQITLTKLVHQDGKPLLDRQVEKKMRAVTITISPHTGVGRLVRPGNRVDVITIPSYEAAGSNVFEVKTIAQNVLVLATGKSIQNDVPSRVDREVLNVIQGRAEELRRKDIFGQGTEGVSTARPDDNYTHVTLQFSPEDAEKVMYVGHAFGDGRLYLTLRNSADTQVAKLETTLLDNILGPDSDYGRSKRRPPPPAAPAKEKWNDIRGGQAVPIF